jgi:hypothetical protein
VDPTTRLHSFGHPLAGLRAVHPAAPVFRKDAACGASRPQQRRVVQPLLDAGLGWEQIGSLVFRLAFDTVVADGDAP